MKNIFSFKNLGLLLCSCLAVSCSEDETTPVTIGDFQVLTPDLEVTISYTDTDPGEYVDLSWDRAKASDGTTVFYEVQFAGKDKNFDTPSMTITPDKLGYANVVQLSQQQMNVIAERTGIRPLQTGEIYWRIRAVTGLVEHVNSTVRTIKVTRQGGFAETPKAIFVYGEATGQRDIANAIPLKQTTDSEYEGFMKLGNGTYSFVNAKEGDIRSFRADGTNLVEESNGMIEGNNKIYHIVLNFTKATCTINEVKSFNLWWVDNTLVPLTFIGNSTWELTNYELQWVKFGRGKSQMYKFRMIETDKDGNEIVVPFGSYNKTPPAENPTETTALDYWTMDMVDPTATIGEYTFKFNLSYEAQLVDIRVMLQPEPESYFHSVKLSVTE
ncbi:MAG: SusE domain-containing protein [Bacteroides fragilis]